MKTENLEKQEEKETEKDSENQEKSVGDEKLSEFEILKQSFEDVKKEKDTYYDQLLRLQAEFSNFRKRSEEEKRKFLEWGKEKILERQIGIYDVLEQALKSAKSGGKTEDIIIGIDMIGKEFEKMLKEEGIEEIKLEKFDPHLCEALDTVESEAEEGTILNVYQKGYKVNGRLMRAAKVKVAKKKEDKIEEEEEVKK